MSDPHLAELPADDEVTFLSAFNRYRLVRKPRITAYTETGARREIDPGRTYEWNQGVLKVRPGRDKMVDNETALAPGEDPDKERDVVEFLMAHPAFNRDFYREGYEPNRKLPREEDVLADMSKLLAVHDVEGLEALLNAETTTHGRPLLTGAIRGAIGAARELREQAMAQEAVPVAGDGENALEWSESDNKDSLQQVADTAGVNVKGTGADGNVTKEDLVRSLRRETKKAREK